MTTQPIAIDVEDAIIARLEAKLAALPSPPKVYPGADLEHAKDRARGGGCVFVAYNGITSVRPLEKAPHVLTLGVGFLLWIVTRSAKQHASGKGNRGDADPIIATVLEALAGWRATPQTPPLIPTEAPGPAYVDGFGFFPLTFRLDRQLRGNPAP